MRLDKTSKGLTLAGQVEPGRGGRPAGGRVQLAGFTVARIRFTQPFTPCTTVPNGRDDISRAAGPLLRAVA